MTINSEGVSEYGALSDFDISRFAQADVLNRDTDLLKRIAELYEAHAGEKRGSVQLGEAVTTHDAAIAGIGSAYVGGVIVATIGALSGGSASNYVKSARVYDDSGTAKVELVLDTAPGAGETTDINFVAYLP